jgi:hypothetical protein
VLPALVFLALNKIGAQPRIPAPIRALFQWFGRVGNITLAVYCAAIALWAVTGFRRPDLEPFEAIVLVAVIVAMAAMAVSFWRTANRVAP